MASLVSAYKPVVIFLHGSGDTGRGAEQWVRSLAAAKELAEFEWHFPDAEVIPYTLAGGAPTSVWYDRAGGFDPHFPEQTASVEASCRKVLGLVESFVARGVPPHKIAVGGFSMGGNMAYQTAARYHQRAPHAPSATFVRHGSADDFIRPEWGRRTFDRLKAAGVDANFDLAPARHGPREIGRLATSRREPRRRGNLL
ncbi:acyl-protein thioesterase [Aureococcus anophagefferens]|nr:acyl-protein thioesterase [Aureococcus anophagefferens]